MKKILFFNLLFLSFINICSASVKGTVYCPDNNAPVNLRPSVSAGATSSLECNTEVEVLNTNAGYNKDSGCNSAFYQVRQGIKSGYACGDFIKITETPLTEEDGTVICIGDDSPLYMFRDLNRTDKINNGGLSCNTKVKILNTNAGKDGRGTCATSLYKIKYNNDEGYVCGTYIKKSTSTDDNKDNNVGKSSNGDNIYVKEDYMSAPSTNGSIRCYENTGDLYLKRTPTGSSTGVPLSCGQSVTVNSSQETDGKCPYYYNVTDTKGNTGYVCSYYVDTTKLSDRANEYYKTNSLEDYYSTLRKKNFPESYLPYLAELHARHPNWAFEAELVPLTFDKIVREENAFGRNLLEGNAFDPNYFSMGINTYDILNNKFSYYSTEVGWYDASSLAVAYYLDPRTYLNTKYILAFELLNYNNNHTENAVSKILKNKNFWNTVYTGIDSNVAKDIVGSTSDIGVSAFHIAIRIEQEISGIKTTDPRAGGEFTLNGTTYKNYYNFFNINVWGQDKILRGMKHAVDNGWNTPYKGIYGGAKFIYDNYYKVNQDTLYYEKFDVSNFTHQYMQNLAVIAQETDKAYNAYFDNVKDYFDKELSFTIPVYKDMPTYSVKSPRLGNPNNYLKELKVNNTLVNGFSYDKYNYEITVPYNTNKINVSASSIVEAAQVVGTGDITLNNEEENIDIKVTSQSGNTRVYKIKVKKSPKTDEDKEEEVITIDTILNSSGIKYNNNYIYGIEENTSINSLINNITKVSDKATINIKDNKGNNKSSGVFTSGDKVIIGNSKEEKEMTIVIYGDSNGDGKIDKDDCLTILRELKGYANLSGAYKEAADANKDGKIDKDDCLAILRHLKGYTNLNK